MRKLTKTLILAATIVVVSPLAALGADVELQNGWEAFKDAQARAAGIRLGKALFWDDQLGSGNGGQYACASCHYQAGADSHPLRIAAGQQGAMFGSLGVTVADFVGISAVADDQAPGGLCATTCDDFVETGALHVTGRNAPPSVDSNSVHNFWDGRANFIFNGLDPSGEVRPGLHTAAGMQSVLVRESSQASQAVGPPNSDVEMAAAGRLFSDLGWKVCHVIPLVNQTGDVADELAAEGYKVPGGYIKMLNDAFAGGPLDRFLGTELATGVSARVCTTPGQPVDTPITITEANFTLFFGLAIQAYEQTLSTAPAITPTRAMTRAFKELRCNKCHYDDGRSHAVVGDLGRRPFAVTGVRTLAEEPGVEVADLNLASPVPNDEAEPGVGFMKSSHLFNLPLTAPYFSDGSAATLEEMLDFYLRGGNHDLPEKSSQVRVLDASPREQALVIELMKGLTDPRIAAGSGPFAHPSLDIPLADGSTLKLVASDAGEAPNPGLTYYHSVNGVETPAPIGGTGATVAAEETLVVAEDVAVVAEAVAEPAAPRARRTRNRVRRPSRERR